MLNPKSPEGALFAQFNESLSGKHAERLRAYKPKAPDALEKRKQEKQDKQPPCAECAAGACPEHADADTTRALEALLAAEE